MDAKTYLGDYSEKVETFFEKFFSEKAREAAKIDKLALESVKNLEKYVQGGKKARGALTVLGHQAAGGKSFGKILPASAAVELMHNALIIHDDFVDNDRFRRGKPTIHEIYAKGKNSHYGASIAIIVGDLGIFFSQQLLASTNFDPGLIQRATYEFDRLLANTGHGEILDIAFDHKKHIGWKDIERIRIYKTAHYTFVMPLSVGAILAGADQKTLKAVKNYGEPVGLAFQLHDDVLGTFGDPKITGKSNESDIKEGKKTLLYVKALELATKADRDYLTKWYGSGKLDEAKINRIRQIIENSGVLAFSKVKAKEFVEKGKKFIPQITKIKKYQIILASLADYMIERDK